MCIKPSVAGKASTIEIRTKISARYQASRLPAAEASNSASSVLKPGWTIALRRKNSSASTMQKPATSFRK